MEGNANQNNIDIQFYTLKKWAENENTDNIHFGQVLGDTSSFRYF